MSELSQTMTELSSHVLAELSTVLIGREPLNCTLQRIAEIAIRAIPEVDEASITLMGSGERARSVVFTGALAVDLDERQYAIGFGPCLNAALGGATVVVNVADPDTPYPDFAAVAARAGVHQVLAVGLPVQQQVIGALNLYTHRVEPFDGATLHLARTFAGYAGAVVANAAQYSTAAELAAHLQQAMNSRAVIEQAKGILMARHACTSDDAFRQLTRMSQHSNRKLRDVAAGLVAAVASGRPGVG